MRKTAALLKAGGAVPETKKEKEGAEIGAGLEEKENDDEIEDES